MGSSLAYIDHNFIEWKCLLNGTFRSVLFFDRLLHDVYMCFVTYILLKTYNNRVCIIGKYVGNYVIRMHVIFMSLGLDVLRFICA